MILKIGDIVRFTNKNGVEWTFPPEGLGIIIEICDVFYKIRWIKKQKHKKCYEEITFIDLELEKMESIARSAKDFVVSLPNDDDEKKI